MITDKSKLARHAETDEHKEAVQTWQSARAPSKAVQEDNDVEDEIYTVLEDPTTGIGYAHVVNVLTEVKRAGSAYDWERSIATLRQCGAAIPHGFDGRAVFPQLVMTCAGLEKT